MEYKTDDLIVPMLKFSDPTAIRVVINERDVKLFVGPRDWQWNRETGEFIGSGTCLCTSLPDEG